VLGTLVLQGLTLRPLMALLRLDDDGGVEREVRLARVETLRAALAALAEGADEGLAALLRRRCEILLRRAEGKPGGEEDARLGSSADDARASRVDAALVRAALVAKRQRLVALRANGTVGDAAFQHLEQELDMEEVHWEQLAPDVESQAPP
jgi:CPA1 family monovalent cation:H+ antiporter